jgi:hypothetical protein
LFPYLFEVTVQSSIKMYTQIETKKGKSCLIFNNYRYLCDRIRNIRILDLMDRHAKGLLTLDDYFIKISKTIGKKVSFDLDVNNNESSS